MITNQSPSKLYPQKVDLTNCDREPIHLIGKTQNHGFLIACELDTMIVAHCSENSASFFNTTVQNIIGHSIYDCIEKTHIENVFEQLKKKNIASVEKIINGKNITIIGHQSDQKYILEFEFNGIDLDPHDYQIKLTEIVSEINEAKDFKERCDQAAILIKDYLEYDRVMIYKFDAQWNGSVISEEKETHLESWLGLQYPASDIPQQARKLFLKQGVRIITDVNSDPINILSSSNNSNDLDLSNSELRTTSPIHIEYLKNMGVGATLTAAIVHNDSLWGLIACHHYSPKYINYYQRLSCKFLTQMFATKIQLSTTDTVLDRIKSSSIIKSKLIDQIQSKEDVIKGLSQHTLTINDLTESTGAALFIDGKIVTIGDCPTEKEVFKMIDFLKTATTEQVYHTNNLMAVYDNAKEYKKIASGVLCLFISENKDDALLWFKPEVIETVNWAGNPNKSVSVDDNDKLSPRKSFEIWSEEQEGKSKPWADYEISECVGIQKSILDIILEKYKKVKSLNTKLKMAYDELESFSYSVSHDLRAPLRGIDGFAHIIKEEYYESLDDYGKSSVETIISSVDKMNMLIDDILLYSGLGRSPVDYKKFSIKKEAEKLVENFKLIYPNVSVVLEDNLPDTLGDRRIINLLLKNLIENAMKYSSKVKNPEVTIGFLEKNTYFIKDNGIGFNIKHKDQIFGVFNRLVNDEYVGSGIGLAIVKRVIDKHNGKIWVESKINKGSTFYFTLI